MSSYLENRATYVIGTRRIVTAQHKDKTRIQILIEVVETFDRSFGQTVYVGRMLVISKSNKSKMSK